MKPTLQDILAGYPEWASCRVKRLKEGYNRTIFLLTKPSGEQYIAKQKVDKEDPASSAERERLVLRFLDTQDIPFVPKVILWDEKHAVSIETRVGQSDADLSVLTPGQITLFALQLWKLHSLPLTDRLTQILSLLPLDSLKLYGFDRLRVAQEACPPEAKEILEWLETQLILNLQKIKETPQQAKPHLQWGDIGENIRLSKDGRLYFIDFEHASVSTGSELAYITIHSHLSQIQIEQLIRDYANFSHRTVQDLKDEIQQNQQITRVNDVVWAAMKWGQAHQAGDLDAAQEYRALTNTRLKLANRHAVL